jgi:SAM-dependent methyltransferase
MTGAASTAASTEGAAWSAGAAGWVEYWAAFAAPAREAVARAAGIEAGASVLDVGCGSGEFCERGAGVNGIDAAEGLVEFARRRLPEADLRVGPIEQLPWPDDSFDLVAGFNAFQFASGFVTALAEAGRVAPPRQAGCDLQLGSGLRARGARDLRAAQRAQAGATIRPASFRGARGARSPRPTGRTHPQART